MTIYYSNKFEREYRKLSLAVKKIAEEREKIFRENTFSPCLKTHKLNGKLKDFWSFSINDKYRVIFEFISKNEVYFHSVGTHSIYELWD